MILVFVKYRVLTDGIRKYNTFINLNSFTCREYEIKVIVLYCIVLYCIVLYCIVLYCIEAVSREFLVVCFGQVVVTRPPFQGPNTFSLSRMCTM